MNHKKSEIIFTPELSSFSSSRNQKPLTIFCGGNNSGKSLILKWLKSNLGKQSYMIGPMRFYHVHQFSSSSINPRELDDYEDQFHSQFNHEEYNHEQNFLDFNRIITNLSDVKRDLLFEVCGKLIGAKFSLKRVDEGNILSVMYIDMDGQNLSVGSTGTRLLMTMLGICMDERFNTILIDEPELGLSPKVQQSFSFFLQNDVERIKYFPHLNQVYIATHSHLFLDKNDVSNNFVVSKDDINISIKQVESISEFHKLQFNLLGNTFESLFLPSAIVVVEGKTDLVYIESVIQTVLPNQKIIVLSGQGDVKKRIKSIADTFGNLTYSPFGGRLFVVNDSIHQQGLVDELIRMGMKAENIITWSKNGIEYFYPENIMMDTFKCNQESLKGLVINDDIISLNGISYRKNELNEEIIDKITPTTIFPEEVCHKLLNQLNVSIL